MKLSHAVFVVLLLACFTFPSFAAGPFSVKNKKEKAKIVIKDIGELLLPETAVTSSTIHLMVFNPATGVMVDGPFALTPKVKKKSGVVTLWSLKKKKSIIIKYKPAKRKLIFKRWKPLPDSVLIAALSGDMVCVPSGTFSMGNSMGSDEGHFDELPVHTVNIDTFFMDSCEVSNGEMQEALQWAYDNGKVIADNTSVKNTDGEQQELLDLDGPESQISFSTGIFSIISGKTNYPCVEVTWYGACAYCNFRSEREGKSLCYSFTDWACDWTANGYRLPTEAEWEKAVRGGYEGNRFAWPISQSISHARVNYMSVGSLSYDTAANAGFHPDYNTGTSPYTSPGGDFSANSYGLNDMPGNVWEWCWDRYSPTYYTSSPAQNPTGPATGDTRALRGGSWKEFAYYCRASDRGDHPPTGSFNHFGFRCVKR